MKEIEGGDYESVKNMLWKMAIERYQIVRKTRSDLEFDDLLGEAMEIYSQCLTTFNDCGKKSLKFSTYLYQNLRARLRDYCNHSLKKIEHYEDIRIESKNNKLKFEDTLSSPKFNIDEQTEELIQLAKEELSYEAFHVFKYIISREWENARCKKQPSIPALCRKFGYQDIIMESIMHEIGSFWNNKGWMVA